MSFVTSNEVRNYIRQVFGKDIEIVDATFVLRIQPTPDDLVGADALDPGNCVFVHTVRRMYGSQVVVFWKRVAYADMLDADGVRRVHRFMVTNDASARLSKFDRGEPFEVGTAITLMPPSKASTLKFGRKRAKINAVKAKKYIDRRKRFVTTMDKKRKIAEAAAAQLKQVMANEKKDTKKIAQIKARKVAADVALKAVRDKIVGMDKSRAKRAPKKFDLTSRNGAIGNYNFGKVSVQPAA